MGVTGVILFVLIAGGYERAAVPVGIAGVLVQAWLTLGQWPQAEVF